MCGLIAIQGTRASITPETMSRALRTIAHRGPDRTSHWFSDRTGLALGHIRLSIIGLNNGEAAKIPFQTR